MVRDQAGWAGVVTVDCVSFDLAQVNVSRLLAPLDSPLLAEFMSALDEVNAEGDAAAGFRWRMQTEDGNATSVRAFGWDVAGSHGVIVNLTTWTSVEALAGFVFSGRHLAVMRRRRQWFEGAAEAMTALWWVPAGHRPSTDEAEDRFGICAGSAPPPTPSPSAPPSQTPIAPARSPDPTTTGSAPPEKNVLEPVRDRAWLPRSRVFLCGFAYRESGRGPWKTCCAVADVLLGSAGELQRHVARQLR